MNSAVLGYGTSRDRAASVSFAEIETAARKLMADGRYPSVAAVRLELKRGSTTTISEAMRRFWKDQAALNTGDPVALTRLPPEFADAAVELWEQALRLSLQTSQQDDNAARAKIEEIKRDTETRARSLELLEKEWDMAARVRERALADAREHVNMLLHELGNAIAQLKARDTRVADLEIQLEEHRGHLARVISRAVSRSRTIASKPQTPVRAKPKAQTSPSTKRPKPNRNPVNSKRKSHGKRR
jgi:Plasmid replication region DNA-binding N-term